MNLDYIELESMIELVDKKIDTYDFKMIKEYPLAYSHYLLLKNKLQKELLKI